MALLVQEVAMFRSARLILAVGWFSVAVGSTPASVIGQSIGPVAPDDNPVSSARLVQTGQYVLNLIVTPGNPDLPTIILESGGGADSRQWASLQPRLAIATGAAVVSYDRPGFGQSPLPVTPYDIVEEADAFREAVGRLGLGRSVVLVGHSYGAFLAQLWASRAPLTVQGILFLDPNTTSAVLPMRLFQGLGATPALPEPRTPQQRAQARVERAGLARFAAVYANPLPLDVPVIVLSAEKPLFPEERMDRLFRLSHDLLAASVRNGKRALAAGSSHLITEDRPDLVVTYVQELLRTR